MVVATEKKDMRNKMNEITWKQRTGAIYVDMYGTQIRKDGSFHMSTDWTGKRKDWKNATTVNETIHTDSCSTANGVGEEDVLDGKENHVSDYTYRMSKLKE